MQAHKESAAAKSTRTRGEDLLNSKTTDAVERVMPLIVAEHFAKALARARGGELSGTDMADLAVFANNVVVKDFFREAAVPRVVDALLRYGGLKDASDDKAVLAKIQRMGTFWDPDDELPYLAEDLEQSTDATVRNMDLYESFLRPYLEQQ